MIEALSSNKKFKDTEKMYQFIPNQFKYLTKTKKIQYLGLNLKTDVLINICNEILIKYLCTENLSFNLWSILLKQKYGKHYNYYFKYLVEKEFIFLVSNYYVGKKARTYKLNVNMLKDIKRCYVTDKVLLKKYSTEFLNQSFLYFNKSPIDVKIRELLVNDLSSISIDYDNALKYIENNMKHNQTKYFKNLNSINSIKTGHLYFKFDQYGRMHTNFTNLKKEIRDNFLKIDNEEIHEIDMRNSQPFFFTKLLKEEIGEDNFDENCNRFVDLVENGLIYDEVMEKVDFIKTRNEAKILMYKVLFGTNNLKNKDNQEFKKIFPSIFEYLVELKSMDDSYKELSHNLQKLESDFIYGKIVTTIKEKYPQIKLFTVHDSVIFPKKYKNEVELIFNILKKEI
jgi:hypothetical protein